MNDVIKAMMTEDVALREELARLRRENVGLRGAFVAACRKAERLFDDGDTTVIQVRITRELFDELTALRPASDA